MKANVSPDAFSHRPAGTSPAVRVRLGSGLFGGHSPPDRAKLGRGVGARAQRSRRLNHGLFCDGASRGLGKFDQSAGPHKVARVVT